MKTENKVTSKVVEFGSKEDETLVAAGYGMTKAEAEDVVKRYEANPQSMPFDKYEKAQAMLARLKAKPIAIDKAPGHFSKKDRLSDED